jgi:glucose-6-phosphate 1-dehydrogenase
MKTLLVIFGITGDLSTRKLLPALSHIIKDNTELDISILGVSRRDVDVRVIVMNSVNDSSVADRTELHTMDLSSAAEYSGLKEAINAYKADQTLLYLSVPPGAATQIVELLGEASINTPDIHLLLEKPFGYDLVSAEEFLERTTNFYDEKRIYRIDHYMAKEVAAEVISLRQDAEGKAHTWNSQSVQSVDIVASESIGIEGRADFYEQTGALRDFLQGHLMQLLSLVLMESPDGFSVDDVPTLRLAALRSLNIAKVEDSIRAQYDGYQEAVENPGSQTETFASLALRSNDDKWSGVPIRITSGKALDSKRSYISVNYKDGTKDVFEEGKAQPADGKRLLDAYERVILEAIKGRKTIFTSGEEVIRSWEVINHVQKSWAMGEPALRYYPQGASIQSIIDS